MAIDYSKAGVNRGRVADFTAPTATTNLTWYGSRRDQPKPTAASSPTAVTFALEGADAASGVTSLVLAHGGETLGTDAVGIPTAVSLTPDVVAVSIITDNTPAGDWTLTLQSRNVAAGDYYQDVATFDFATS